MTIGKCCLFLQKKLATVLWYSGVLMLIEQTRLPVVCIHGIELDCVNHMSWCSLFLLSPPLSENLSLWEFEIDKFPLCHVHVYEVNELVDLVWFYNVNVLNWSWLPNRLGVHAHEVTPSYIKHGATFMCVKLYVPLATLAFPWNKKKIG